MFEFRKSTRMLLTLFILLYLSLHVNSYVLLQVSKDNQNRSNVDALIHKVVPAQQADKLAKKIARKQFSVLNRGQQREYERKPEKAGWERGGNADNSESDESKDNIKRTVNEFVKKIPALKNSNVKLVPEVVQFRSKPSLVYELDSSTLIRAIKQFLSSPLVARYTDDAARQAAAVYHSIGNV